MVGQTISHYRITSRLGSGGMGVVYRADDLRLERPVALKFLPDEVSHDLLALHRLQREARAASALTHPNIRTIYHLDEHDGHRFIVMELLEGRTLEDILTEGPMPSRALLEVAVQVAAALEAAHAKGIVHRDIKPANVFLTTDGVVKVMDFGLAARESACTGLTASTHLTAAGTTLGTTAYMSPEQVRGEPTDARSDLFSLGVMLYEMATGRLPFAGATIGLVFEAILNRPAVPPREHVASVDADLENLILRSLQKDPALRHQSATEVLTDLRQIRQRLDSGLQQAAPVLSAPAIPATVAAPAGRVAPARRRVRLAWAGGLVAVFAAAALAAGWMATPATYDPCIVLGDVRYEAGAVEMPAGLVEFELGRTLGQSETPAVFSEQEYALAVALAPQAPQPAPPSWVQALKARLVGNPASPARQPELFARPVVHPSLAGVSEVDLELTRRGTTERLNAVFKGTDDLLLTQGVDDLATAIRERFDGAAAAGKGQRPRRSIAELLSSKPDAVRSYWQALLAWRRLNMTVAEREAGAALENDGDFALARVLLAEVRVFQNQWAGAQAELVRAAARTDALTPVDDLRIRALQARASMRPFDERVALQRLINARPQVRDYAYELGESYFHAGDSARAAAEYRKAIRIDPDYALAFNHLGYCLAWTGDHAGARLALERYLQLDPSPNASDSLGDAHIHAGEYALAAQMKQQALDRDPTLYFARRSLAFVAMFRGHFREAQAMLDPVPDQVSLASERARFHAALAFLHLRAGRPSAALDACARGTALMAGASDDDAPNDELAWLQGLAAIDAGRPAEARAALARLRRVVDLRGLTENNYKPAFKYWLHLSAALAVHDRRSGDARDALARLEAIPEKLGYWSTVYDKAFFFDAIGQLDERLGDVTRADAAYATAIAYNPHFAMARLHQAQLLRGAGRTADARRQAESFLEEWRGADADAPGIATAREIAASR